MPSGRWRAIAARGLFKLARIGLCGTGTGAGAATGAMFSLSRYGLHQLMARRKAAYGCMWMVTHMDVGGDDSWSPSGHQDDLLPPDHYHYQLQFRQVSTG